ncbi:J domain-containing protein [Paenibacillus sp. A14]|uniref:J domain-containing protein n=1 Tax=Paenibacillus sp. A14 TaxID=3119820 RepID=UPI002FE34902
MRFTVPCHPARTTLGESGETRMTDYYAQLGVARDAGTTEIRQAYRKLAKRYHPDVNRDNPEAEARFKQIVEAYETLNDESLRADYDRKLASAKTGRGGERGKAGGPGTGPAASGRTAGMGASGAGIDGFDPVRIRQQFEQFFAKVSQSHEHGDNGQEAKAEEAGKNPLDTTAMFNQFFGYRKK